MLPWQKEKDGIAAMALPVKMERKSDEDGEDDGFDSLEGAMSELHSALNAKDFKGAAAIFRSAMELCDSEPHVEGPHTEE